MTKSGGFGQSVPPETIVHIIEDTFLSSTKVIELDYFSCGRFIVVSQDTTVCVFSFPKILYTIHPFLSLNHKSVCFTLPLFNKVTIAILNANNQVANNRHARAITREFLVCRLCIIELQVRSVG